MFGLKHVFGPPAITDLTQDPEIIEAFTIIKLYLDEETSPQLPVPEIAVTHMASVEVVLLEYYVDKVRREFYENFDSKGKLCETVTQLLTAQASLKTWLFSPPAQQVILRSWTALVRTIIDFVALRTEMLEFTHTNPLCSDQALTLMKQFCELGLGDEVWKVAAEIAPVEISKHVKQNYTGKWEISVLEEAGRWLSDEYLFPLKELTPITPTLEQEFARLVEYTLAELRIDEIHSMIVNLPKSEPGFTDLKQCLNNSGLRSKLVEKVEQDLRRYVLNNGVTTVDIFLIYLKCITAFSMLDPRGVLLEIVSAPMRDYLKDRSDSVKIVVTGLMGEQSSPLAFLATDLQAVKHARKFPSDSEWQPDPIDTPANFGERQVSDTIATLLSLYGNKDIVILQFTEEFAKRLLSSQTEEELTALQSKLSSLKKRFGSRQLQNIDVMIDDIQKSAARNLTLKRTHSSLKTLSPLILSKMYWPNIDEASVSALKLPSRLENLLLKYQAAYELQQTGKKIKWLPSLGRVSISVELQDRSLDLLVTPDQAAIIGGFESSSELSLPQLMEFTGLSQQNVLLALRYWIGLGVIGSDNERYQVLETEHEQGDGQDHVQVGVAPGVDLALPESEFKSMEIYWSYIQHMLTNVGPLSVDRIHSFLVMLVPKETPYVKTSQQLENFLMALVSEDKLKIVEDKFILV